MTTCHHSSRETAWINTTLQKNIHYSYVFNQDKIQHPLLSKEDKDVDTNQEYIFSLQLQFPLYIYIHYSSVCNYTWIFIKSILSVCLYPDAPEISVSTLRTVHNIEILLRERTQFLSFSVSLSLSLSLSLSHRSLENCRHVTCLRLITQSHVSFALTDPNQAANNNHVNSVSEGLPESGAKTFYENLPFHGIQSPPNKVSIENRFAHENLNSLFVLTAWRSFFLSFFLFSSFSLFFFRLTRSNRPSCW